jgi:hypothetical protein
MDMQGAPSHARRGEGVLVERHRGRLTRFVPVPDWCLLNIVRLRRQERP